MLCVFFFSSRRRHTRWPRDWSSDVCSSDLGDVVGSDHQVDKLRLMASHERRRLLVNLLDRYTTNTFVIRIGNVCLLSLIAHIIHGMAISCKQIPHLDPGPPVMRDRKRKHLNSM